MRRLAGGLLLAGTLAAASPLLAGHTPAASFPTLRSDAVKRLLDVREPVVLVDMRKPAEYRAGPTFRSRSPAPAKRSASASTRPATC